MRAVVTNKSRTRSACNEGFLPSLTVTNQTVLASLGVARDRQMDLDKLWI